MALALFKYITAPIDYSTVQYSTVQYSTVQYSSTVVQYSTVQYMSRVSSAVSPGWPDRGIRWTRG